MADERTPGARRRPAKAIKMAKAVKAKAKAPAKKARAPKAAPTPKPKARPEPLPKPPGPIISPIGIGPIGTVVTRPPVIERPPIFTGPIIAQPVTGIGGAIRIPGAGGAVVDTPAPSVTPPPQVVPVQIPDTTSFISRIRPNIWDLPIFRPSKTVVVSQSPMPGDVVPAGTPITVTTTVKQLLPLSGLQVSQTLVDNFRTAGAIEDLVTNAPPEVQNAVTNRIDYAQLGEGERATVDQFLNANVPTAADLDPPGRAQLFGDISFVARI